MERRILGIGFLVAVGLLLLPATSRAQNTTTTLSSQYLHWRDATNQGAGIDEGGCFTFGLPEANSKGGRTCYRWIGTIPGANTLIVQVSGNVETFGAFGNYDVPMETVTVQSDAGGTNLAFGSGSTPCINGDTSEDHGSFTGDTGWMAIHQLSDFDLAFAADFVRLITPSTETWCCFLPNNVSQKGTYHNPTGNVIPYWLVRVRAADGVPNGNPADANGVDFDQTNVTLQAASVTTTNLDPYFGGQTNACGGAPDGPDPNDP